MTKGHVLYTECLWHEGCNNTISQGLLESYALLETHILVNYVPIE